jgi:FPC/CPF motif-containing protein YcgG
MKNNDYVVEAYKSFLGNKAFPCVAARAALVKDHVQCLVVEHMDCPKDDNRILEFLYQFVDKYRQSDAAFHSAAVIFKGPELRSEDAFDALLWHRLQALYDIDALHYPYDNRVDSSPSSPEFSFSLKSEAFFVIGLHPSSSRPARQFMYPTLVFNPHAEFEKLRSTGSYEKMQHIVRRKDVAYSGSVNPMLKNFGSASDAYQYSGKHYNDDWQCPLKTDNARPQHHPTP